MALCQYDSRPGAYRWNAEHALRYAREAVKNGASVIVLPEYSFCTAADALDGSAFGKMRRAMRWLGPCLARFCRRYRCHLFVNIPHESKEADKHAPTRRNRMLVYNPDGCVAAIYDKRNAAAIDILAQVREGDSMPPVDLEFGRVGLMICRDTKDPQDFTHYCGVDLLVVQFAHIAGWNGTKHDPEWMFTEMEEAPGEFPRLARELCPAFDCPALFANKTGLESDGVYTGGSCVADEDGTLIARAGFGGDVLYADFELDEDGRLKEGIPPVPYAPPMEP